MLKNTDEITARPRITSAPVHPFFIAEVESRFCCRTKPAWRLSGIEWFKVLNKRGMFSGRASALGFDALRVGNSLLQLHFGLRKGNKPATEEYGCERSNPSDCFNLFQISFPSSSCPRYECNDQLSPQPFRLPLPMRLQSTMIEPSIVGVGKL